MRCREQRAICTYVKRRAVQQCSRVVGLRVQRAARRDQRWRRVSRAKGHGAVSATNVMLNQTTRQTNCSTNQPTKEPNVQQPTQKTNIMLNQTTSQLPNCSTNQVIKKPKNQPTEQPTCKSYNQITSNLILPKSFFGNVFS